MEAQTHASFHSLFKKSSCLYANAHRPCSHSRLSTSVKLTWWKLNLQDWGWYKDAYDFSSSFFPSYILKTTNHISIPCTGTQLLFYASTCHAHQITSIIFSPIFIQDLNLAGNRHSKLQGDTMEIDWWHMNSRPLIVYRVRWPHPLDSNTTNSPPRALRYSTTTASPTDLFHCFFSSSLTCSYWSNASIQSGRYGLLLSTTVVPVNHTQGLGVKLALDWFTSW